MNAPRFDHRRSLGHNVWVARSQGLDLPQAVSWINAEGGNVDVAELSTALREYIAKTGAEDPDRVAKRTAAQHNNGKREPKREAPTQRAKIRRRQDLPGATPRAKREVKERKQKGTWGGARVGSGPKPLTDEQRLARQLEKRGADVRQAIEIPELMASLIGLSPRMAIAYPSLVNKYPVVTPGEHVANFSRVYCQYHQLGEVAEGGPKLGEPVELVDFEREFLDEALSTDDNGRRIYKRTGEIIGRKNRKTTKASILSLYFASPADGEHRPVVVQAAGVLNQAGKLYNTTRAFIDDKRFGSELLLQMFVPLMNHILCPPNGGEIFRVAGDGDNNMSLDPHVVMSDELHTWKTPRQRENWKALTTAQGGRLDPFILFFSTEGDGDDDELAGLMERIDNAADTEVEERRPGLTIYRNMPAGLLVFKYAAPTTIVENGVKRPIDLDDVEQIKLANPAPWRTIKRLKEDLVDPMNDKATKLRLYGNVRGGGPGRWISDEAWAACYSEHETIPLDAPIWLGADGARTRDTTAIGWCWLNEVGQLIVRCRVWSTRQEVAHHVFVPGRLNNDLARDFIRDVLVKNYDVKRLGYDERYFDDQADDLSEEDGLVVVEMQQNAAPMQDAWDDFYERIHEGAIPGVLHDGDPVLRAHVRAAGGVKTERGWRVSKIKSERPIDGLAAIVLASYASSIVEEPTDIQPIAAWG